MRTRGRLKQTWMKGSKEYMSVVSLIYQVALNSWLKGKKIHVIDLKIWEKGFVDTVQLYKSPNVLKLYVHLSCIY